MASKENKEVYIRTGYHLIMRYNLFLKLNSIIQNNEYYIIQKMFENLKIFFLSVILL